MSNILELSPLHVKYLFKRKIVLMLNWQENSIQTIAMMRTSLKKTKEIMTKKFTPDYFIKKWFEVNCFITVESYVNEMKKN
jgi:hypothetical protein